MNDVIIRPATHSDLEAVNRIYNYYIEHTAITFDVEPWSLEKRAEWFTHYGTAGRHRCLVVEPGGAVAGYATSSPLRPKAAYATSVETSVYLAPALTGRGPGSRLYQALFDLLACEDVHRAYAIIALPNPASIQLHLRFGFRSVGVLSEVGRKFGCWHSTEWFEKAFTSEA
ncbi:MAG TPA: GNAT family N-acetyltransferase [Blastocatellia bacterium]|nr:GNAT family N-acetyltransferase [Blastocatellia bacterium]